MTHTLEIAGRTVGADAPLFVIAEIGLNHGGSLDRALAMVDAAADAGVSAVKVQALVARDLVAADCAPPAHVDVESLRAFFERFELSDAAYEAIAARARARGLGFIATPLSLAAVTMLERIGVDAYKIASGDLTYDGLIEACARTGKPLVISTGMSNLEEIGDALVCATCAGAREIALLHCVSAYPVPAGSENLRAIQTLATFGWPVGLSDHAPGTLGLAVGVALGAALYERHLEIDADSLDHDVSSTPREMADVVATAAAVRVALGDGVKACLPAESFNRDVSRRALRAARALRAGDVVTAADIVVVRPAAGLAPGLERDLIGTRLRRDVAEGEPFLPADLDTPGDRHEAA